MKWFAETTEWSDATIPNGVYLLDDSKSKMYAFRPFGGAGKVKVFKNPIKLDTRGRKFKINDVQYKTQVDEEVPEGRVFTVKGSKGDEYRVSELNGEYACTCSGFKFRSRCKHTESVRQTV
jgi:hypothetical protein